MLSTIPYSGGFANKNKKSLILLQEYHKNISGQFQNILLKHTL